MFSRISFSLLAAACTIVAQKCPIQFDGRVPKGTAAATLDTSASPFNPSYVFGAGKQDSFLKIYR
jgi:hypothetical protein